MAVLVRNSWLRRLAVVLVTAFGISGMALSAAPAKARVFVGLGVPLPGVGYYAPPPYYPYAYPAYWYYPGGVFVGGAFGPHHHYYYYHHRR
jgi:hypothetical protein